MRITRNIFLTLGILFITFEILAYIGSGHFIIPPQQDTDQTGKIAFFIGYNLILFLGLIFLAIAYFLHKKIQRRKHQQLVDSLLQDDNDSIFKDL